MTVVIHRSRNDTAKITSAKNTLHTQACNLHSAPQAGQDQLKLAATSGTLRGCAIAWATCARLHCARRPFVTGSTRADCTGSCPAKLLMQVQAIPDCRPPAPSDHHHAPGRLARIR